MVPLLAVTEYLPYLFPLVGSVLLSYGIYQVISDSKRDNRKRIQDRLRGGSHKQKGKKTDSLTILKQDYLSDGAGSLIQQTIGKLSFVPKLQTMIEQANLSWSAANMLAYLVGAAIMVGGAMIMLEIAIIAALGCGLAIIFLPIAYVSFRRKRRLKKLVNQLPDVFEMMSQALRAGHSLASAIHLIHEQMPDPISSEFGRVFHEQNLGIKIDDALLAMAERVDSLDVRMFVTAVLIQRTTGGDLAEILDKIGSVIRGRIELYGQVAALTSEGRLSGWVLFGLPILVFVASIKLNYDYASMLWTTTYGKLMLAAAAGMQLMGLAVIRWIVNIKV